MHVTLVRRWGQHQADGKPIEVSDSQAAWLIQHNYAQSAGDLVAPVQPAAAEGTHGADPLAGGDATRLRPHVPRSTGSTAHQATGSSPTYRAGYTSEDAKREGVAGRNYRAPAPEGSAAASGRTKKPASPRGKSGA